MNILNKSKKDREAPQRHRALLLTAASTAAVLCISPLSIAHAEVMNPPDMLTPDVAPVSDAELDQNRGGFSIGGVNFSVGMTVRTTIEGASDAPVSVTTNFSIDKPGVLTNLGPSVVSGVHDTLADAGIGNANTSSPGQSSGPVSPPPPPASPPPPPASPDVTAGNTQTTTTSSNSSSGGTTSGGSSGLVADNSVTHSTGNTPGPGPSLQSNAVSPSPPPPPTFTAKVDPNTNSINLTNNAGTNVGVSTAQGLLTTISNQLNGVTVSTEVDLNYVIHNYQEVVTNSQNFQQAMSIAQQLLALHGIMGN